VTPVISVNHEPSLDEKRAQLARVLISTPLQNAPMLQKLLQFLGTRATEGSSEDLNEWVIATRVFGRPKEFDATTDTTVRTAVYRLRSKLREYFAGEGKHDAVVIEIPKGHHLPVFVRRELIEECPPPVSLPELPDPLLVVSEAAISRRLWPWATLGILLLGAGLLIGRYWGASTAPHPLTSATGNRAAAFWRAFAGGKPVIVAYSNAELLQTESRDLIHFDKGAVDDRGAIVDPSLAARCVTNPEMLRGHHVFYEDGYTGTGEVQAAFSLTRLLTQLGIEIQVKRVRLLTSDDFKAHNVVLLGSSLENRAIDDLRLRQGFVFMLAMKTMWAGGIMDTRPAHGGPPLVYNIERDPTTQALQSDYALVGLQPGVNPNSRIMILGGLTTSGTQGAAEYMTSDSSMSELLSKLNLKQNLPEPLPTFESLLQIRVVRGLDPVSVKCVTARPTSGS
jgi:hypothetical protein